MQLVEQGAPAPIATPPNFPVTWRDPADEQLFWTHDGAIHPRPMTPLSASFLVERFVPAINLAEESYGGPVRLAGQRINTYLYTAVTLAHSGPEEAETESRRGQDTIEAAMARLESWWRQELLPEIEGHLAAWEAFDRRGASPAALLAHLEETAERMEGIWLSELLLAFPRLAAPSMFADLYQELFPAASTLEPYQLLEGFDNKTLETDRALWDLSRHALAPRWRPLCANSRPPPSSPRWRGWRRPLPWRGRSSRHGRRSCGSMAGATTRSTSWPSRAGWRIPRRSSGTCRPG
jgi:hypothetical protein